MSSIEGLHHVSVITGDAAKNVAFYTGVLGLRLVAKSVNQDDPTVYHLFFGSESGEAGADLTFFEYPRAVPGRVGAGMVHKIVWRIASKDALVFWEDRLKNLSIEVKTQDNSLTFSDGEGLTHELRVTITSDRPLSAIHPDIPSEFALQGFAGVRAYSADLAGSELVLSKVMGAVKNSEGAWEMRGDLRSGWIAFDEVPNVVSNQSAGIIHHVAFGLQDDAVDEWLQRIENAGLYTSGVIDRTYFKSIYFREPGGILYELATEGPGFIVDGPVETFGEKIILPPQFEAYRSEIEQHLTVLPNPRENWVSLA